MKAVRFALVAVFAAALVACGGGPEANLSKKWKMSEVKMNGQPLEEFLQKQMEQMLAAMGAEGEAADSLKAVAQEEFNKRKEEMKKEMESNTMEFKADGTYTSMTNGKEEKGTWKLSEDAKTLTVKRDGSEKEDTISVKELTAAKLVFETGEEGQKTEMTLVPAE